MFNAGDHQGLARREPLRIIDYISVGIEDLFPTGGCFVEFSRDRNKRIAMLHDIGAFALSLSLAGLRDSFVRSSGG